MLRFYVYVTGESSPSVNYGNEPQSVSCQRRYTCNEGPTHHSLQVSTHTPQYVQWGANSPQPSGQYTYTSIRAMRGQLTTAYRSVHVHLNTCNEGPTHHSLQVSTHTPQYVQWGANSPQPTGQYTYTSIRAMRGQLTTAYRSVHIHLYMRGQLTTAYRSVHIHLNTCNEGPTHHSLQFSTHTPLGAVRCQLTPAYSSVHVHLNTCNEGPTHHSLQFSTYYTSVRTMKDHTKKTTKISIAHNIC